MMESSSSRSDDPRSYSEDERHPRRSRSHRKRSHTNSLSKRPRSPSSSGGRKNEIRPKENRCLGVFGLNPKTSEDQLYDLFSRFGRLEKIKLIKDSKTNESRGYCFIYFEDIADAKPARVACDGINIDYRRIRVDYSITTRSHSPTPGHYLGRSLRVFRLSGERMNIERRRRSRSRSCRCKHSRRSRSFNRHRRYSRSRSYSRSPRDYRGRH